MSWIWLALSILSEVAGTLCLRASSGLQRKIWVIPVAVSYLAAFWFLSRTLAAGMPLGVAYGLWAACGVALVSLLSRAIWKDPLTRRALIGIGCIVVGVILVEAG
ncbi:DMT family transporter [Brevibacterium spongiae]|uniref:SMR family transporter n=1 Tax=Brevibacterium spongiae TaxID=2909672 RepID=A0ABY5SQE3_9MICO|nr:SMR family transporter [Brevibacterium spongiae]UVI36762.1 SMR family transporter [Brevibacterium spongiae]